MRILCRIVVSLLGINLCFGMSPKEACEEEMQLAKMIMDLRQRDEPQVKLLSLAQGDAYLEHMVRSAYDESVQKNSEDRTQVSAHFSLRVYEGCLAALDHG